MILQHIGNSDSTEVFKGGLGLLRHDPPDVLQLRDRRDEGADDSLKRIIIIQL
jgi:hypothetical protein